MIERKLPIFVFKKQDAVRQTGDNCYPIEKCNDGHKQRVLGGRNLGDGVGNFPRVRSIIAAGFGLAQRKTSASRVGGSMVTLRPRSSIAMARIGKRGGLEMQSGSDGYGKIFSR